MASGAFSRGVDDPVVETATGKVRGIATSKGFEFRGIRYGVAERFMPPREPRPWAGVADAASFGASAPQTNASPPPGPPYVILAQIPRPADAPPPPPPLPESEDCLFLNVWTSAIGDGRKRPVMVWLHGGFFYGGTGSTVDGANLAATGDAVVVSLNHRLNAFGFTHLADIAGADFAHSGNAGMLDIVLSLRWVRDNIERFGGDPERVMVFGTSGGGMKTTFLTASPAAHGLLHRAGVQSGPGLRFMERDAASEITLQLLTELGLCARKAQELRAVPTERLLAAYHSVAARNPPRRFIDLASFSPVLDPDLLPAQPYPPAGTPNVRSLPLLIGSNNQEMSFFMGNDPEGFTLDEDGFERRVADVAGDHTGEIVAVYRDLYRRAAPSRRYVQFASDYAIKLPVVAQAERFSTVGDCWLYRLDLQSPALGGKLGALHTIEGNLIFNTPEKGRALLGSDPAVDRLAAQMSAAWLQFAATGSPEGDISRIGGWNKFVTRTRPTMVFDKVSKLEHDPDERVLEALRPLLEA